MSTYTDTNDSRTLATYRAIRDDLDALGYRVERVIGREHGADDEVVWMTNAEGTVRVILSAEDQQVQVYTFTANRAKLTTGSLTITGANVTRTAAIVATLA